MAEGQAKGVVFIGKKPTPNYVLAVVTQFRQGASEVTLKARGRSISRAVDTAELTKRFLPGHVEVSSVKIGSETVGEPGKQRTVSTIEIVLSYKE